MNGQWTDVENLLDLLDHVWIGIVLIVTAAVPSWLAARNHKTLQTVKSNVVNGHTVPMRADLDKALSAIEALAHDVNGLRQDVAMEEDRRRQQINELREEVERHTRRN